MGYRNGLGYTKNGQVRIQKDENTKDETATKQWFLKHVSHSVDELRDYWPAMISL